MGQKQVLPLIIIISCFGIPLPTSFLSSANFLSMSGMKPSSCDLEVTKRLMPHYRTKKCIYKILLFSLYEPCLYTESCSSIIMNIKMGNERSFSVDITDFPKDSANDTEQVKRAVTEISKEDISKLFAGRNLVFISTLSNDGSPHVIPVWADMEGEYVLINTFEGSAKVKNARRDPRVALSIVDTYNTYNMVSMKGKVVDITPQGAEAHLHKLAKKYLGIGKYYYRKPRHQRVIMKVKPEKVMGISIHPASLFLAYLP